MNIIVLVTCCYRDEITAQFFRLTRSVPAWFSSLASVFPLLPASVWHSAHRILIPDLLVVHPVHNEGYLRQQYAADRGRLRKRKIKHAKPVAEAVAA